MPDTLQIHTQDAVEIFRSGIRCRGVRLADACIVDGVVDTAQLLDDCFDRSFYLVGFGEICDQGQKRDGWEVFLEEFLCFRQACRRDV